MTSLFKQIYVAVDIYWTKQLMHHLIDKCIYQTHQIIFVPKLFISHNLSSV